MQRYLHTSWADALTSPVELFPDYLSSIRVEGWAQWAGIGSIWFCSNILITSIHLIKCKISCKNLQIARNILS